MTNDDNRISKEWLKEQARKDSRIEYNGPKIKWPINKLDDRNIGLQRSK
jgi:hypothetical protein